MYIAVYMYVIYNVNTTYRCVLCVYCCIICMYVIYMCIQHAGVCCVCIAVYDVLICADSNFPASVQIAKGLTLLNLASLYCIRREIDKARKALLQVCVYLCVQSSQ